MNAAVERAGAAAVARLIDAMAGSDLPAGVTAERVDGGLRLTGARLLLRWIGDVRLRGLAVSAARGLRP